MSLALLSCSYPTRNLEISKIGEREGYRWATLPPGELKDTLVIVTASGGGTRAAALELSVLRGLEQVKLASGASLSDKIDIISSVSGGSVTAAYFALYGTLHRTNGLPDLENDFIRANGVSAILFAGLNPVGLAKLSTPKTERIDLLIDYLDKTLFKGQTFAALKVRHQRPYLVLNAADMVQGVPFPETQEMFDLLCSDLLSVKLSTAVAASAAFPVVLSPVTYHDYSPCAAQKQLAKWPPRWVKGETGTDWYDSPDRADLERVETSYAAGGDAKPPTNFVHLLDGGIADNLGVAEPLRMLTTDAPAPAFLEEVANGTIKKIVFVMINARSFAGSTLDTRPDTPGILDMLFAAIDAGVDRTTFGTAARLRTALKERFEEEAGRMRRARAPEQAANLENAFRNTHLIEIDFDAIADPLCRQNFHDVPTSWALSSGKIDALLAVGKALLLQSLEFQPAVAAVGGKVTGSFPTMDEACALAAGK